MRVIEQYTASAKGDLTEDLIVETDSFVGIFDGVTGTKDAWRHLGKTMGQYAAALCGEALKELKPDATVSDFAILATDKLSEARKRLNLELTDRLASGAIIFPKRKPCQIWSIGDCHYGYKTKDGQWVPVRQSKLYDDVALAFRDIVIAQEIAERGEPVTKEARAHIAKIAWECILPAINKQMLMGNHPDPKQKFGFGVLTGATVPAHHLYTFDLPDTVSEVVLCSDGLPEPMRDAAAAKAILTELREADPLLLGRNRLGFTGNKGGFVQMNGETAECYDDVSYIRLAV